ncbi:glucose-6-phosphate 1-dehydrogenase [Spathaspora passalidarum NRRL Y-27907]|uniref:Glucose-6-phosphate 1-dehydrogenase n=1 Tax=Spathaspora passalidarum (strain NRRL Y-27907 / 11-Y1) TaxID=619300 RepID=G3AM33_SPAPN|nr:glucose-6-phosphate 1-dehydrogenase [Spathaspora passalidarum NRRL Y-27907]EGW32738.1 glucose-6-phosphate 1-dehydrogenase [Spathaspora passalidarum NRRL Y-27907]
MTTTVPLIYSFPEFLGVADAVADHVISAQNQTLYNTTDPKQIELIKSRPALLKSSSGISVTQQSPSHSPSQSQNGISNNVTNGGSKAKKDKKIHKKQEVRFKIAISGGSLIKILHQGLLPRQEYIEWDKWDIYFADERLVPFDSPDSNYGQAKREIFDLIEGDKKPNIYHIDEELIDDNQEAADDYEKQLIRNFAKKDSVKLPMFDLLLLGCAPDGHIASLFPNFGEQLREKLAWCLPVENAPSGPKNRITLSIPVICHAARVTFVVEGKTKAPIIRTIMERPEKGLPSSIVNEGAAGRVSWFVDDAALNDLYDITKKKYKFLSFPEPATAT